jgi:3-polyprenyl-4-hydroxybenzoate decarboxylase
MRRVDDLRFPDLRAFLASLRRDRQLATVDAPVDARLEAARTSRS